MNYIESVFSILGSESTVTVDGLVVRDNDISGIDGHLWNGIIVPNEGEGFFSNVTFCRNAEVQHVASVGPGSSVEFDGVEVCALSGGTAVVS